MVVSAMFEIKKGDNETTLLGYGETQEKEFWKDLASTAKNGKIYRLKLEEVNSSGVQRNYMFVCLKRAADEFGYTPTGLRIVLEDMIVRFADNPDNDRYERDKWVVDLVDIKTGEITGMRIAPMSKWKVSMMSEFIELLQKVTIESSPRFVFPNPKDYAGKVVGTRNLVGNEYKVIETFID